MSQVQNVQTVRRLMQRFIEQDVEGALEHIDSEATLDWSNSDAPDRGVYKGHPAWRAFIGARDEALGHRDFEFVELLAPKPDTVVVIGLMREQGRASGVEVAAKGAAVFTLRQGKVIRLRLFQTSEEALAFVGAAG